LTLKIFLAVAVGWLIHEALARKVLFQEPDVDALAEQVNAAFCDNGVPVFLTMEWAQPKDGSYTALAYTLAKITCPASSGDTRDAAVSKDGRAAVPTTAPAEASDPKKPPPSNDVEPETGEFYRLRKEGVSHPQVKDSLHVLVRRAEKVWQGRQKQELLLCSESRRPLSAPDCANTEAARVAIERQDAGLTLGGHLAGIKLGSLILGPWQWLTLSAFLFALVETVGLWSRWVKAPSFVSPFVDKGLEEKLSPNDRKEFERALAKASTRRVRSLVDRFLEKALSPSTTPAESRLRNFRDMQVDECVSRLDTLEAVGDTMLKIAFMGTVFGIGTALFAARDLDASDPLLRLVAKSNMYAGIGMGFGATLVGILLSILAAKSRAWLSGEWLSSIDDAWRRSMMFYDGNYGGHAIPPVVPGVTSARVEYLDREKSASDKAIDAILTTLGYVGILAVVSYLGYILWTRYGGELW
jgi:hypothetical protein